MDIALSYEAEADSILNDVRTDEINACSIVITYSCGW